MGIFRKDSPEEKARMKEVEALNKLNNSYAGRAKSAYNSGLMFYEVRLTLEDFKGIAGITTNNSSNESVGRMLTDVCEQGWELFDVGYQFKFYEYFSSSSAGGNINLAQYKGKSVAHYIFKRASKAAVKQVTQ